MLAKLGTSIPCRDGDGTGRVNLCVCGRVGQNLDFFKIMCGAAAGLLQYLLMQFSSLHLSYSRSTNFANNEHLKCIYTKCLRQE